MTRAGKLAAVAAVTLGCAAAPARAASPPVGHVFVVVLENKGYAETFGAGSKAHYLSRTLTRSGQLLSQYHAIGHESLDNYIALVSGQAPNPQTQADCQTFTEFIGLPALDADGQAVGHGCVFPPQVKTVADQLAAKGLSWKGYMQDMGTPCRHPALNGADDTQKAEQGDQYAARHNPFVYFHSIIDTPSCARNDVPLSRLPGDLAHVQSTASLSLIVPNLCNDGHDAPCVDGRPGGLVSADAWLSQWIPKILGSPAFGRDGVLVVTFDEAEFGSSDGDSTACCGEQPGPNSPDPGGPQPGPGGGRVGAVVVSPFVEPGSVNPTPYNHYSLLRTLEDLFGVGHLGFAGQAGLRPFGADVFARAAAPRPVGGSGDAGGACAGAAFARASARPRGRGLALAASAHGSAPVAISIRLTARGRRVLGPRTVRRFRTGHAPAVWRPRRLADGLYVVRFAVSARAGGGNVRHIAVARRAGRFHALPAIERLRTCGAIRLLRVRRPAFGGRGAAPLRASFRLGAAGAARLELLRGGRVVRRLRSGRVGAGRAVHVSVSSSGLARGSYRLRLTAGGERTTVGARVV
jgi:phosphatidylinositol-3-phosphatase